MWCTRLFTKHSSPIAWLAQESYRYTFLSCHDVRRVKKEWSHDINGRADAAAARLSSILWGQLSSPLSPFHPCFQYFWCRQRREKERVERRFCYTNKQRGQKGDGWLNVGKRGKGDRLDMKRGSNNKAWYDDGCREGWEFGFWHAAAFKKSHRK